MKNILDKLNMYGLASRFFHHRHEPNEIWRDIPGYNGDYRASSLERIWSRLRNHRKGGLLSPSPNGRGYPTVTLHRRTRYVHDLIYETFYGPKQPSLVLCHRDDRKTNNSPENLRQDTRRENWRDAFFNANRESVLTMAPYDRVHIGLFDRETDELVHCFGPIMSVIAERKVMGDDDLVSKAQIGIDRWKARKACSQG